MFLLFSDCITPSVCIRWSCDDPVRFIRSETLVEIWIQVGPSRWSPRPPPFRGEAPSRRFPSGLAWSVEQWVSCQPQRLRLERLGSREVRAVHTACLEAGCMKDLFEWKRQRLTGGFPSSSSSWLPWRSASSPLCINNERFQEQLRQVQTYLNVLKTKRRYCHGQRG